MTTALRTSRFTVLADLPQDQYEILECEDGPEGIAELNRLYPASSGWMIVDSGETLDEAERIITAHKAEARMDFE